MNKATKRVLAILATLSLLFACTVGASAAAATPFGATVTITKQPTDNTFVLDITEPDLAGLEVKVKIGSVEKTIVYDDLWEYVEPDEWFDIYLYWPEEELKPGNNTFYLDISVSSGDEYYESFSTPITFKAVGLFEKFSKDDATALKAGLLNKVTPGDPYFGEPTLYSFTPKASGYYTFRSFSRSQRLANFLNIFSFPTTLIAYLKDYIEDPSWYDSILEPVLEAYYESQYGAGADDPFVTLVDADGNYVAYSDDASGLIDIFAYSEYALLGKQLSPNALDFALVANLEAGKTYYLLPESLSSYNTYYVTAAYTAPALF